jgi:hypothetical protein
VVFANRTGLLPSGPLERGGLHAISIEKIEVIGRPVGSKIPTL